MTQEWDWPLGAGAKTRAIDGRVHRGKINLPGPAYQRPGDIVTRLVIGTLKVAAAVVCTALVIGSVGFLVLLIRTA